MRDVEIVVDPEEVLLDVRVPRHRERIVTEELAEDLLLRRHGWSSELWRSIDDRLCATASRLAPNGRKRRRGEHRERRVAGDRLPVAIVSVENRL